MAMPVMRPVDSSNIARIGYSNKTLELYVEFASGDTYIYSGVPAVRYEELLSAGSKGRYLNQHIKPNYPYRQL